MTAARTRLAALAQLAPLRTTTVWRTPTIDLQETFVFDMAHNELPIRLVLWDHLQVPTRDELEDLRESYATQGRLDDEDPTEAFMGHIFVPDANDEAGGGGNPRRARAVPEFSILPEVGPWFYFFLVNEKRSALAKSSTSRPPTTTPFIIKPSSFVFMFIFISLFFKLNIRPSPRMLPRRGSR